MRQPPQNAVKRPAARRKSARGFVKACLIAAAVIFAALVFLPDFPKPAAAEDAPPPFLALAAGAVSQDFSESEISDYSPMFLPTRWNSAPAANFALPVPVQAGDEAPIDAESASNRIRQMPYFDALKSGVIEREPSMLKAALKIGFRGFFEGFGRADYDAAPRFEGGGDYAVFTVRELGDSTPPQTFRAKVGGIAQDALWAPAEFALQIDPAGGAGAPAVIERTGLESADAAISKFIAENEFFKRLKGGYYKIVVSP